MKTIDEMVAVMTAARDGKPVQFKPAHSPLWQDTITPNWNWAASDYRIKPEPKRVPLVRDDINQHRDLFRRVGFPDAVGIATIIKTEAFYTCGYWFSFSEAMVLLEISRDAGKTWSGCWKEVAS